MSAPDGRRWRALDAAGTIHVLEDGPLNLPAWLSRIEQLADQAEEPTFVCGLCRDIGLVVERRYHHALRQRYDVGIPCLRCERGLRVVRWMLAAEAKRAEREEKRKKGRPRNQRVSGRDAQVKDDEVPF